MITDKLTEEENKELAKLITASIEYMSLTDFKRLMGLIDWKFKELKDIVNEIKK